MTNKKQLSFEEQYKILSQGVVDLINKEEFLKKLKENRPLKVKAGFDPSSPDLHLGHSLLINKLRQFQELGHQVIFVVGDFTACIGDPSGQNKTRPALSFEESQKNALSYKEQATKKNFEVSKKLEYGNAKVFEFFKRLDPNKTELVYNSEWFDKLSLKYFILDICSKHTIARQLERRDFRSRYESNKDIGLHEFLYPILQAYDSKELKADVEIGGTDQLFNLLLGRELQEQDQQSPQVVLTLPLLKGITTIKGWKEIHDLKAYLTHRKIEENPEKKNDEITQLAEDKDFKEYISESSIKMKISNYKYLDEKDSGLSNFSKQSKKVYEEHKNKSIEEIKEEIKQLEKETNWIIEGADKMSKSLGNAISFNEKPREMYGKVMSISDERLVDWWKLFTEGEEDLTDLFKNKKINPKTKKEELAWLLVCSFYGEETADKEKEIFKKERTESFLSKDILEHHDILDPDRLPKDKELTELLVDLGLCHSKSEARRKILEGAVRILEKATTETTKRNEMEQIKDPSHKIEVHKNQEFVLGVGKRKFKRVNTKWDWIHDLKAYHTYRTIEENPKKKNDEITKLSKDNYFKDYISKSSIGLKIANYTYLDTNKGLEGYSKQSEKVYKTYKDKRIEEIEKAIEEIEKK